ncbi:phosphotransferase enzyme family protein [Oceanirhabdus sp. W0125-5]|uniref:phosphotransferase enzyme family protein n=1 Tax=Oceanirhabdus sp. W0125-5 TaxID=2999116 RepID=UPI0022F2D362|nr:phosphotransferase [Oceanirhabdus sp. W0125-5]WBW96676.1 phosphotransferase [Oceanirhabdus sp. W0125-5]
MMKLKHLINNDKLAELILKLWIDGNEVMDIDSKESWEHFRSSENATTFVRASSNTIYIVKHEGERFFLRYAPVEEKEFEQVKSEIEFVQYLRTQGYEAVEVVPSKTNKTVELIKTEYGTYVASMFKGAKGDSLEDAKLNEKIMYEHGKNLARLHNLSKKCDKKNRPSYLDIFERIKKYLKSIQDELALKELELLKEFFLTLQIDDSNFGLIHYDFELDNIIYNDENDNMTVIDFDDSMYHWFVMDIVQALESISEEVDSEDKESFQQAFLEGYRSEKEIDEEIFKHYDVFKRFGNLYGYMRTVRSCEETVENEPEWMPGLRERLENGIREDSAEFGKAL